MPRRAPRSPTPHPPTPRRRHPLRHPLRRRRRHPRRRRLRPHLRRCRRWWAPLLDGAGLALLRPVALPARRALRALLPAPRATSETPAAAISCALGEPSEELRGRDGATAHQLRLRLGELRQVPHGARTCSWPSCEPVRMHVSSGGTARSDHRVLHARVLVRDLGERDRRLLLDAHLDTRLLLVLGPSRRPAARGRRRYPARWLPRAS